MLRRAGVVAPYDAAVTLDFINHIISAMREAQFTWHKPKFVRRMPQFTSEGQFTAAHSAARPAAHIGADKLNSYIAKTGLRAQSG